MARWFYKQHGKRVGPVSQASLVKLFEEGELGASSAVWTAGMAEWTPASDVNGLVPRAREPVGTKSPPANRGRDLDRPEANQPQKAKEPPAPAPPQHGKTEFVRLSCLSCGGQLRIGQDVQQLACIHCGTEYMVNRGGGVVSLGPVIHAIRNVQSGVDRTAAELSIPRLREELAALEKERERVDANSPIGSCVFLGLFIGLLAFIAVGVGLESGSAGAVAIGLLLGTLTVLGFVAAASWYARYRDRMLPEIQRRVAEKKRLLEENLAIADGRIPNSGRDKPLC